MRKPSCSIFFCAIFLAQFFSMSGKWFGVWENISLGFSHMFGFLPPELECNFTLVWHSLLSLFPTVFLVWCYLPRVTVREWGRWCRQTPSCWNTQQIAASEGLLCSNDLLYQAGRDTRWENSPKMIDSPQFLPDYMHNRLKWPTVICANNGATLTLHWQTKLMFFMTLLELDYCSFLSEGVGRGGSLWQAFIILAWLQVELCTACLLTLSGPDSEALVKRDLRMTCVSVLAFVVSLQPPEGHRLAEEASWNTQSKEEHSWHGCVSQSEVIVYVNILVKDSFPLCCFFGKHITTSSAVERNR